MVCGPATLIPKYIHKLGVKVEFNLKKALQWTDVANILRIQLERQGNAIGEKPVNYFPSLREYAMEYGVNMYDYE